MFIGDWKTGNRFNVTMTRISPSFLDDDNVVGALKAVRDEIAAWIGLDDRHEWIKFKCMQQRCKQGFQGLRITIECNEPGEDKRHVMKPYPELIGDPVDRPTRKEKPASKPVPKIVPTQQPLAFVPAYAALPWMRTGDDEYELQRLKDLGDDPPKAMTFRRKLTGEKVTYARRRFRHPELGECWLYGPSAREKEPPSERY